MSLDHNLIRVLRRFQSGEWVDDPKWRDNGRTITELLLEGVIERQVVKPPNDPLGLKEKRQYRITSKGKEALRRVDDA